MPSKLEQITEGVYEKVDLFIAAPGRVKKAEKALLVENKDGGMSKYARWYRIQNGGKQDSYTTMSIELKMSMSERDWFLSSSDKLRDKWMTFVSGFSTSDYVSLAKQVLKNEPYPENMERRAIVFDMFKKAQDPKITEEERKLRSKKLSRLKSASKGVSVREYHRK